MQNPSDVTLHNKKFIPELESLRGIAALAVALTHHLAIFCLGIQCAFWQIPFHREAQDAQFSSLIGMMLSPTMAVILFFVLSGFVLSESLEKLKKIDLKQLVPFYIKRLFRIFPLHIFCLLLFSGLILLLPANHGPAYSIWYKSSFPESITLSTFVQNIFLVQTTLNSVIWTLPIELFGSLLVPFFVLFNSKKSLEQKLLFLVLLIIMGHYFQSHLIIKYAYCFYLGTLLTTLTTFFSSRYFSALFFTGIVISITTRFLTSYQLDMFTLELFNAIGAAFIIIPLLGQKNDFLTSLFDYKIIKNLGKISYSFYLFHYCTLYVFSQLFLTFGMKNGLTGNVAVILFSIPSCYFISKLLYACIEKPSIFLGKRLASRFA